MDASYHDERQHLLHAIRKVNNAYFEQAALGVFRFQAKYNPLFRHWLRLLRVEPARVERLIDVPCVPIRFFKQFDIQSGCWEAQQVFTSSGTTGTRASRHLVRDPGWYLDTCIRCFSSSYDDPGHYAWLALLPSYLERQGSSLIAMADHFIEHSIHPQSGFFLHQHEDLVRQLETCIEQHRPTILLGVSFALLDLAERYPMPLNERVIVMETGGMKGRRPEITREALHRTLQDAFGLTAVHSEYGMTELFSQAYSKGSGLFTPPPTMRVLAREITDPLSRPAEGRTGALDIIDLANLDTLSFIATDDLGRVHRSGAFEVLGRLDDSDIRGCNLMVA